MDTMEESCFFNHQLLSPASVLTPLTARTKADAIDELFVKLNVLRELDAEYCLKSAVLQREREGCTGIGHGVAVAHGKRTGLPDIFLCLGVSPAGIEYGAYDEQPVHLLFLAANPPLMQAYYLETLAALSRFLRDREVRERLIREDSRRIRQELLQVLYPTAGSYSMSA